MSVAAREKWGPIKPTASHTAHGQKPTAYRAPSLNFTLKA